MSDPKEKIELGHLRLQEGRIFEADAIARRLAKQFPDHPAVLVLMASIADASGNAQEGDRLWSETLKLVPDDPNVHLACALSRIKVRRFDQAIGHLKVVIAMAPLFAGAYNNLGNLLDHQQKYSESIIAFAKAITLDPGDGAPLSNISTPLLALGLSESAVKAGRWAIRALPQVADAYFNLGVALHQANRDEEAVDAYQAALELSPNMVRAHYNLGLSQLRLGQFAMGWSSFEWRHAMVPAVTDVRSFQVPHWRGEPLSGRAMVVHAEQGLGDTIQFARYVAHLRANGARIVFMVKPGLGPLMHHWLGGDIIEEGAALPRIDYHCPMMSLPGLIAPDPRQISVPDLRPDDLHLKKWIAILGAKAGLRIGLVVSGRPSHSNDANRSIPIKVLQPLFTSADITFHLLQNQIRPGDEPDLASFGNVVRHDHQIGDFLDTVALVELMDLVISVDTSVAHLAASMGKPTWITLPFWADWRWGLDRSDSDWYSSVRLFRQDRSRDWRKVVWELTEALRLVKGAS